MFFADVLLYHDQETNLNSDRHSPFTYLSDPVIIGFIELLRPQLSFEVFYFEI